MLIVSVKVTALSTHQRSQKTHQNMWTTHPATANVITKQAIIDNTHKKYSITNCESESLRDINFTSNCFTFCSVIIMYVKWNSQDIKLV